ncbi:hypothetical protein [Duganella sp. LjRoot269]|uniref:hypothetical protein n=1 Tax=Duganella sp. LjRoot269 TaxID=3342305 RepID=UPI003ECF73CE
MMRVPDLELTKQEQVLLEKIQFDWTDHDQLRSSLAPMAALSESLLQRAAIPEVRLRYFIDPECNPGGRGKSRQAMFERNGTGGNDILDHPHFLQYLEYFVFGPKLPSAAISEFKEMAACSGYLTAGDVNDLAPGARAAVRSGRLNPAEAADEFFKLAIECGAVPSSAEMIRNSIRQVRL